MRDRLVDLERRFSPEVEKGPGVFSPLDRHNRSPHNLGGDKMSADRHGYADVYAEVLAGRSGRFVMVELGVFLGSSLAVWDAMFPDARLIGLDLELCRFRSHLPKLQARGAFPGRLPELAEFDAYQPDRGILTRLLDGDLIDVFIDDGPHAPDAIVATAKAVGPLMAPGGVYIVEDQPQAADLLRRIWPDADIVQTGQIAVACRLDPSEG